jgi:hypothetical protein
MHTFPNFLSFKSVSQYTEKAVLYHLPLIFYVDFQK